MSYHELEAELAGVERALERLDDGTYGQCEACGELIDEAVLESTPTVARCAEHQGHPEAPPLAPAQQRTAGL